MQKLNIFGLIVDIIFVCCLCIHAIERQAEPINLGIPDVTELSKQEQLEYYKEERKKAAVKRRKKNLPQQERGKSRKIPIGKVDIVASHMPEFFEMSVTSWQIFQNAWPEEKILTEPIIQSLYILKEYDQSLQNDFNTRGKLKKVAKKFSINL